MGAQWKHVGRLENSSKRGALISKLVKEITVAAKVGDPQPEHNARLRAAVEAAKKASVPRDNIERAIKKGAGLLAGEVHYEQVFYEGFTPHQVPVIVECLTDNKNRTAAGMRVIFRKGMLGSIGSVHWMFNRLGVVEATHSDCKQDLEGVAIESCAQDVEQLEASEVPAHHLGGRFFCDPSDLDLLNKTLTQKKWVISLSEINYVAKNGVELPEAEKKEVTDFLNLIHDHDDVHRVYTALKQ